MHEKSQERLIVKLENWPDGDQDAWAAARQLGDVLEPGGAASEWSPASVTWMVNSYGHYVGWVSRHGLISGGTPALNLLTRENVAKYVAEMRRVNASSSVADRIQKISLMARAMAPERDWEWLRAIYRKLARVAVPARDKRSKLVSAGELYRFGIDLMTEGEALAESDRLHGAVRYRDGLMIALLIARPILRRKNLRDLTIGESLVRRGEHFALQIDARDMKQREPVNVMVPTELTPFIDRYIAYHRPYLFPRNRNSRQPFTRDPKACRHLWVSMCGTGMTAETIYQRFVRSTRAKFGKSVNPHLCRDIAATSWAIEDPTNVRCSVNVLGHADYRTTEGSYNLARSFEATQRYQTNILGMRKLKTPPHPESRCTR